MRIHWMAMAIALTTALACANCANAGSGGAASLGGGGDKFACTKDARYVDFLAWIKAFAACKGKP